jgi:sugar/nucleoside kinase (ribokinase family)
VGKAARYIGHRYRGRRQQWPLDQTARFANALGSLVAARRGAIPDWTLDELYTAANLQ